MKIDIDLTGGSKLSGYIHYAFAVMIIVFVAVYFAFDIEVFSYRSILVLLLINALVDACVYYMNTKTRIDR